MDNNINDIRSLAAGVGRDLPEFVFSPSAGLQAVVAQAAAMSTKLWIDQPADERHDLDVLVAAGQISTCFNVIEYLWQNRRNDDGSLQEDVRELFAQAKADWERLNQDPYWLVDKRNNAGRQAGKLFWNNRAAARRRVFALRRKAAQPT